MTRGEAHTAGSIPERFEQQVERAREAIAAQSGTETEERVAGLWRRAFDREDIRLDDPFLELGGDSLTAAVIAAGVHEAFGIELGLSAFASEITITTLAALIDGGGAPAPGGDELPRLRKRRLPPASCAQRFMWHAAQVDPAGLTLATAYRITGPLDVEALRLSLERLIARHEVLRTAFISVDEVVVQLIGAPAELELPAYDFAEDPDPSARAAELLGLEAQRQFDLKRGPLVFFRLVRTGEQEHQLLRINHHLVADAPSWQMFFEELAVAYEAALEGRPSGVEAAHGLQYADYAAWEWTCMQMRHRAGYQAEIEWWVTRLAEPSQKWWPRFQRPERLEEDPGGPRLIEWGLAPDRAHVIDQLGRDGGATYYMTRLAVYSALLGMENGVDDVLLESFFSTRRRAELQRMIGVFINRTLLRLRFDAGASFREYLAVVRRTVIETSAHATIPQIQLRGELAQRGVELPISRTRFAALHQLPQMRFGGLTLDRMPREQLAPRGFVLGVDRNYDAGGCRAVFDPRNYDAALVSRFIDRLQELVAAICVQPDAPLAELHAGLEDRGGAAHHR